MSAIKSGVKADLRRAVRDLEAVRERLRAAIDSLPVDRRKVDDEPGSSSEVRSILECILADSLDPAIRDLENATQELAPRPVRSIR